MKVKLDWRIEHIGLVPIYAAYAMNNRKIATVQRIHTLSDSQDPWEWVLAKGVFPVVGVRTSGTAETLQSATGMVNYVMGEL